MTSHSDLIECDNCGGLTESKSLCEACEYAFDPTYNESYTEDEPNAFDEESEFDYEDSPV